MSVFTSIDSPQLESFLSAFPVKKLIQFKGIEAGITNSNFFVDAQCGYYVLTIVEHESSDDVEWFMHLLAFLHRNNIPCAKPIASETGEYSKTLAGKPATLVERLSGKEITSVSTANCSQIGEVLAQLHVSCLDYSSHRTDSRGPEWRDQTARKIRTKLMPDEKQLLDEKMSAQYAQTMERLPSSVIHADLFRDNVLFDAGKIGGIIDFYYACTGCMLYDLAITFNDWCRDENKSVNQKKAGALLRGYEKIRALETTEREAWPMAVQCAALRFWLSRVHDFHFPCAGVITSVHNPLPFKKILLERSASYADLTSQ